MICPVIYIDSSVLLADVFAESNFPPESLWDRDLGSSRLLIYEVWNRINARGPAATPHSERARGLMARIKLIEMSTPSLTRALTPFPVPVRTLDALHLATMHFVQRQGEPVELASYNNRLLAAAAALGIPAAAL